MNLLSSFKNVYEINVNKLDLICIGSFILQTFTEQLLFGKHRTSPGIARINDSGPANRVLTYGTNNPLRTIMESSNS